MKMATLETKTIRIAQFTFKFVKNAPLVHNLVQLSLSQFEILFDPVADTYRVCGRVVLWLNPV